MGLRPAESIQRQAVIGEACTWFGTPYQLHSAEKGVGVDCQQLVVIAYRTVGLPMASDTPRHKSWVEAVQAHRGEAGGLAYLAEYMNEVETPQPGDTALFEFWGAFIHSAIVVRWPTIVHQVRTVSISDYKAERILRNRQIKFLSPKSWS
jgi:cell wall-associated NlpC family hydrolase